MTCATCQNYRYIEDDHGMLHDCPDCRIDHPRCPVHDQMVVSRGGRIGGRCWECVREAADAKQWLRDHPYQRAKAAA